MQQKQVVTESSASEMIQQCLAILKRHRYVAFLSALSLASLAIVGISLLPNIYRATTTILVDPQKIPERYVASTVTSDPNERLNTLKQQILSSSRLQEIIDRNNLYPRLRGRKSREEILDLIRKRIKIELVQGSDQGLSSFTISYEDGDRSLVAPITNQLAASFIDWNLAVRQQQAHDTAQFLSGELERAKKSLEEQEGRLQAFKMTHVGATPDQLDANLQALSRLQTQIQANTDSLSRLEEERLLLTQTKSPKTNDLSSLSERGRLLEEKHHLENQIWDLRRQFTDTYPDVVIARDQLKNVNARLAALPPSPSDPTDSLDQNTQVRLSIIDKEIERRKQQQTALQHQVSSYQGKVDEVPVLETQLTELTRNYEISRQNYQSLLDKSLSAGMSQDLERQQQAERFIVLDPAGTPEKPVSPKRLPLMAGAVLVAFLLAPAAVIGIGLLSGTLGSEDEIKKMYPKVPILGTIPAISSRVDVVRGRRAILGTVLASATICIALILFLHKVKPIL
ncbi:MAG TPA: hypothetical protein VKX41_09725 [Alloacidobacterium sp.]|jgi:succinoglycan biosynthesis transport protein ExoP|nr:hypothetical protein [Alloacidobacterium sp.]